MSSTSPEATLSLRRGVALDLDLLRWWGPLAALLALTGLLCLWGLSRNGYANSYYAAAVQAGTHSWKAFLFGSLDAANYITVDKPPASLWLMELSSRLFGFSSFSMLLPQALEGVAAVGLLYATMRRWFGARAALISGLILAITPVAVLMFRFNNPDGLLVLLLIVAAYALTRAIEGGSTRWIALAGGVMGFAFLTKELQAFLVLPGFVLAYLVAAPVPLRRRLWQLGVAGAALVVSAGWWIALVELWPAGSRPYIGGSSDNSIVQLILGYNGLDRISSRGGGPGGGFSGSAGILRLFNSIVGGQISWLLPASAVALVAGGVWTRRRSRTDRTRAALLLWGGWLVVTAALYSFMTGVIHAYYTNTLAPPIAVLVGVGATMLWCRREQLGARLLLTATVVVSAAWAFVLLDRTPDWQPWLRFVILFGAIVASLAICAGERLRDAWPTRVAAIALLTALAGPAAFTLDTVTTAHAGSTPSAGPAIPSAAVGPGPGGFGGRAPTRAGPDGASAPALASKLRRDASRYRWVAATSSAGTAASLELATDKPVMAIGGFSGGDPSTTLVRFEQLVAEGKIHYYVADGGFGGTPNSAPGGFRPPVELPDAGFPPGAFGGLRPPGAGPPRGHLGPGGPNAAGYLESQIQSWVSKHFKSSMVGRQTVYDLTQPKAGSAAAQR